MASLVKRQPRKHIRVSEAAEMIGCSSKSIRTGNIGNFKLFRLKPGKTSPTFCWRAEVEEFLKRLGRDA